MMNSPTSQHPTNPERGFFVAGTDTGVGKTYVASRFLEMQRRLGVRVGAYKPVASGAGTFQESDTYALWIALGQTVPHERITPQSFAAPLAPPLAAEREGRTVDERLLVRGAAAWRGDCDLLVVEGAGGLMSPISWSMTNADLAAEFGYPLILVAENRLGAVHQILATAIAAMRAGLRLALVVLNQPRGGIEESIRESNPRLLQPFLENLSPGTPVMEMGPREDWPRWTFSTGC